MKYNIKIGIKDIASILKGEVIQFIPPHNVSNLNSIDLSFIDESHNNDDALDKENHRLRIDVDEDYPHEAKMMFIMGNKKTDPTANEKVIEFIADFICHKIHNTSENELIRSLFMDGYCLHFAYILKNTFNRGTICWCAPFGHIVWMDVDGIPYDIEGVSTSEAEYYIPIRFLKEELKDFKRIPGEGFNATEADIDAIIKRYNKYKETKQGEPK